ncbi:DUF7343 domain-containing protein [Natronorubrum bangense]|uniref:HTH iclR-type domain-containing protein n=2 Tax=Natronorubrum bangense TaxID=61858 RepID=L9WKQ1_9EURY|nr:hypothetical protein [Natronorubrum bangense]ELY50014.1 hypothetical protein C494_06520 [Natronorubrum bangense JCM 10635]QCC54137.1 hypothetical protein DV706_06335 [Natronorubrum bangense]
MNVRVGLTVVVAVLLVGMGPIAAASGPTAVDQDQSTPFSLQQDQLDADEIRMDVTLRENGTAEWTLEFWVRLDDEESTTAFESLEEDIQNDPDSHMQSFADRMDETVVAASDTTGREMSAEGYSVTTERQSFAREYGVVRYTFHWHGFGAVDGDEIHAGDAIEGIYIDDGTRLLVAWPEDYELQSATPDPDEEREHAVIWRGGETDFIAGEPQVVITAGSGPNATIIAGAAVVALGLGAVGVWWYRTRDPTADRPAGGDENSGTESGAAPAASAETATTTASSTTDESAASSGTEPAEMELLSNEEQVLRLVRDNGGRMKQQTVVEELGWTDAKTSKVVSGLREEGDLESFRLGRENVLSLPDADDEVTAETME